ncbi:MAG: DegV family EDD domain-containing protein [Lachnospiraceae bacterium]|nr:DegV family EDD domain-containing protein [Lachnospiraceae bacterium]
MLNKFKEMIFDRKADVQDRLFLMLTAIAMTGMIVALFAGILVGENIEGTVSTIIGFFIMLIMVYTGIKLNKIRLVANIIAFILVIVFFPVVFFTSGGIYGGSPIWFVFAILYIGMILKGPVKFVMLGLEIFVAICCYCIQRNYPQYIYPHTINEFYADSLASLVIVGLIMSALMTFQVYLYTRENKISQEQKEEIDALNKAQNRFFSSMSHEIRTPINTIIGLNEMILREDVSDEVAEDAATIQAASKMLLSLINDILDMSKMQSGQMELSNAPYNTSGLILDVVSMMQTMAREKGLDFNTNISPDLPGEMIGDEVRIKQILINVLNNAVKYTKQGYVLLSVQCEMKADGSAAVIYSVTDTGIGIKKENIQNLFTAFKRVDEDKNRYIEGTGLGLSIVKQLVDMMGGKVSVNSVYTKGTTFIIEIPQRIADSTPVGDIDEIRKQSAGRSEIYHQSFEAPKARVLAVDDTAANLMVVTKLLRKTGIQIDTAANAAEALGKTLEKEYQVVLMDHMMPEMDGVECMHIIHTQTGGLSKEAKIIALTANAGSEARAYYEKEGFDGYLLKPISGEALEKEILRLLPKEMVTVAEDDVDVIKERSSWIRNTNKKANVLISTPTASDIPQELLEGSGISLISPEIETENGCFRDGIDMDTAALLSYMEDRGKKARIKPIKTVDYESFFADRLQYANNIVHVTVSGKITDTGYYNACEAVRTFDNVSIVDSGHISTGLGIMALEAGRMASEGYSTEEIIRRIGVLRRLVRSSFIVDGLDYLVRSKQIKNHIIAKLTKAFMIRPVLELKKGKMIVTGINIGSREHSWKRYISKIMRNIHRIDRRRLFITHVGLSQKELDWIKAEVNKRAEFDEIYVTQASASITVNVGPGTFGLIYMKKEK